MDTTLDFEPGKYSRALFYNSLETWNVGGPSSVAPSDWPDAMWRYYALGLAPGSFFGGVLANDLCQAMAHSHPANPLMGLKLLCGWLNSAGMHGIAWGSTRIVDDWLRMSQEARLRHLVDHDLAVDSKEEVGLILADAPMAGRFSSFF